MTGTNHVLAGVVIGFTVQQPMLAIPLALGSHFVMDALPHYGDPDIKSRRFLIILTLDGLAIATMLLAIWVLQPVYWLVAVACGLVAAAPDFMWLPNFLRALMAGKERKPYTHPVLKFHKNIQWAERPYYWPIELVSTAALLYVVAKLLGF